MKNYLQFIKENNYFDIDPYGKEIWTDYRDSKLYQKIENLDKVLLIFDPEHLKEIETYLDKNINERSIHKYYNNYFLCMWKEISLLSHLPYFRAYLVKEYDISYIMYIYESITILRYLGNGEVDEIDGSKKQENLDWIKELNLKNRR